VKHQNILFTLGLLISIISVQAQSPVNLDQYRAKSLKRWKSDFAKFDELNRKEKHPDDSILFIGSSSIRLWADIATDMAPYHPIQRGFGGSRWSDHAVFADQLITPHKFRALVCFVANDITGKKNNNDKSPQEIVALFSHVWAKARVHQPDASIFYIAVTPTESRLGVWLKTKKANSAIRAFCESKKNTYFIGTESIFFDQKGKPRSEYFREDKLHSSGSVREL
jgi:hypothetical protein